MHGPHLHAWQNVAVDAEGDGMNVMDVTPLNTAATTYVPRAVS
jgi:hypothetical protein